MLKFKSGGELAFSQLKLYEKEPLFIAFSFALFVHLFFFFLFRIEQIKPESVHSVFLPAIVEQTVWEKVDVNEELNQDPYYGFPFQEGRF